MRVQFFDSVHTVRYSRLAASQSRLDLRTARIMDCALQGKMESDMSYTSQLQAIQEQICNTQNMQDTVHGNLRFQQHSFFSHQNRPITVSENTVLSNANRITNTTLIESEDDQ